MQDIQTKLQTALKYHQDSDFQKAREIYTELLKETPDDINIQYFYGMLLVQTGKANEAKQYFEKIIAQNLPEPLLKDSLNFLGEIAFGKNDLNRAKDCFQKVLEIHNSDFAANFYLGHIYLKAEESDKAIKHYLNSLRAETNQAEIYKGLIDAYKQKYDLNGIIKAYLGLIEQEPKNPYNYYNVGLYFDKKNDTENALKAYLNALHLKPDFAEPHTNIGNIYHLVFNLKNAEKYLLKGLELNDEILETYIILGNVYIDTGELDKLYEITEKGLKKFPQSPHLLFNVSRAKFLEGKIEEAWDYFKYRRLTSEKKELKRYLLDYTGSIKGKKILVYRDTGFGDSIQFLRYVPLLKQRGAEVMLHVQEPLIELAESSNLGATTLSANKNLQEVEHDLHINLISLPYYFKSYKDRIPFQDKYISVNPDKVEEYRKKYFDNNNFKVGIVWLSHVNAYKKNINDIMAFYEIAKIPGIKLYSLQQTKGKPMFENLPEDFEIVHLGDDFKDFTDTAAVIENLDLTLTIDTAVAHLAGAMGKSAWCLLPDIPNWRWFMRGETTPWYNSMRLFRQKTPDNWDEVLAEVKIELEKEIG